MAPLFLIAKQETTHMPTRWLLDKQSGIAMQAGSVEPYKRME